MTALTARLIRPVERELAEPPRREAVFARALTALERFGARPLRPLDSLLVKPPTLLRDRVLFFATLERFVFRIVFS